MGVYSIYTEVCGHPFKLVDSAISAIPVADRCIKAHSHAISNIGSRMARTEELSDFQRDTVIRCLLSNKSVHQISGII